MNKIFKKIIVLSLAFIIGFMPCIAKEKKKKTKFLTNIQQHFYLSEMPSIVKFKTKIKTTIFDDITIRQRSIVTAEVINAQKERRWHKGGFILCKLLSYETELGEFVDLSDRNLYLIARKYEPINKKEAAILGTEIIVTQGASFFAPGVDILYFFTKGAILRKQRVNWFKAGVANAYENSICWFWLKGKPIDLEEDEEVLLKGIEEERVIKLNEQVTKRKGKEEIRNSKREIKKDFKTMRKETRALKKFEKPSKSFYKEHTTDYLYSEIEFQTDPDYEEMIKEESSEEL